MATVYKELKLPPPDAQIKASIRIGSGEFQIDTKASAHGVSGEIVIEKLEKALHEGVFAELSDIENGKTS